MVRLRFESDLSTSIQASRDLEEALGKVGDKLDLNVREAKKLETAAKRIVDQNLGPLEQYNQKMEQLAKMQASGALTADQAARAATRYRADLMRLQTGFVSLTSVEESAKKVTAERNAQLAEAERLQERERLALKRTAEQIRSGNMTAVERFKQQLSELNRLVRVGELTQEDATRAARRYREELFGVSKASGGAADGIDAVISNLGGFASAGAVIGAVTQSIREMDQEAKRAAENVMNNIGSFGELQQVSATPEDFAKNVGRARGLVRKGIVKPDQQGHAADIVFAMVSAGYTEPEKDFITQLGEKKFVKPEGMLGMAESMQKIRRTFGAEEAGTLKDVVNKVAEASTIAQADLPETMGAILEVAKTGASLGMSDEAVIAGLLTIENQARNIEAAGTRYRSMLAAIDKKGLWKGDLASTVEAIRQTEAAGTNIYEILGESRAVEGYRDFVIDPSLTKTNYDRLMTAAGRNVVDRQSDLLPTDPVLGSASARQLEEGSLGATIEASDVTSENLRQAIWAGRRRKARERGYDDYSMENLGQYSVGYLTPDDVLIGGERRGGYQNVSPETARAIELYWTGSQERADKTYEWEKMQAEALEEQKKQTALLQEMRDEKLQPPGASGRQER